MRQETAERRCYRIPRVGEALPALNADGTVHGPLHLCTGQEALARQIGSLDLGARRLELILEAMPGGPR